MPDSPEQRAEHNEVVHHYCAHCGRAKEPNANYVDDCGMVGSTFAFCANCGGPKEPNRNYVHEGCLCRDQPRAAQSPADDLGDLPVPARVVQALLGQPEPGPDGFQAQSRTTPEGRTVAVLMTADFARLLEYAVSVHTDSPRARGSQDAARLVAFLRDLRKVNP